MSTTQESCFARNSYVKSQQQAFQVVRLVSELSTITDKNFFHCRYLDYLISDWPRNATSALRTCLQVRFSAEVPLTQYLPCPLLR